MTRSKLTQVWFAAVALVVAAGIAFGVAMTVGTVTMLLALCLVPPALLVMLSSRPRSLKCCTTPNGAVDEDKERAHRESMTGQMKGATIMNARALTLAGCAFGIALLVRGLDAQDLLPAHGLGAESLAQYRNFTLKSDLPSVSALAGAGVSAAKTIHQRPAVLQELEWRPSRWLVGSTATSTTDPVEQIVFSFYNDQLFRVTVDYARDRTEGMTDADMVDAISEVYGLPVKRLPGVVRTASRVETESGSPMARWGDADHAVVLYRTSSYGDAFRLIVTDRGLDDLARKAETQAMHLDEQDAPRREIARQQKEKDDGRAVAAKARIANKGVFRP